MTNKEQILHNHVEALKAWQEAVIRDNAAKEEARVAAENLLKARAAWDNANAQFNEVYGAKRANAPTLETSS